MKLKTIYIILFLCFVLQSHVAPSWATDSATHENSKDSNKCQAYWTTTWSAAKAGNLEKRAELFSYIYPIASHSAVLLFPGRSNDFVSRHRDAVIMGLHSFGAKFDEKRYADYHRAHIATIVEAYSFDAPFVSRISACLRSESNLDCTEMAQESGFVPSFDDYAKEIDRLVADGFQASCYNFRFLEKK